MPRPYRARAERRLLSEGARRWLLYAEKTERDKPGFDGYCDARWFRQLELWREHRAELLGEFIEAHPGRRPYAWWLHDCPSRAERLKLGGSGEPGASRDYDRVFGYFECDPADPPRVESEAAFLKRLGLLLPGEEKRISKWAWRPMRLKVDSEGWAPPLDGDADAA